MNQEDVKKTFEALGGATFNIAGDFVFEKNNTYNYTIEKVETGGIGMQFVNGTDIPEQQHNEDEPLRNLIFKTDYFNSNDKLVKLRNTIAAAIDMGDDTCLYGEPQEKRINPSNKNEWYYIRKAIVESGVAKSNLADKDFVEQMVDWFPKLFPMEQVDTIEAEKRKLAKSISGERSRWRKGSTKQEVALKDTMASGMVRTLGTKAQLMFEIAYKGLCLRLSELKHK